jgi:hypothetical protein
MTDQFPDATKMVLSPAAQAVFHAFNSKFDWIEDGVPGPQFNAIAAALRATSAHLLHEKGWSLGVRWSADELRSLATQLESAP